MNAMFFGLAFLAALNPKLFGIDLLLIQNARPRLMFSGFLLGGLTVCLTVGLLDVLVLHSHAINPGLGQRRARRCPWGAAGGLRRPDRDRPPAPSAADTCPGGGQAAREYPGVAASYGYSQYGLINPVSGRAELAWLVRLIRPRRSYCARGPGSCRPRALRRDEAARRSMAFAVAARR
jgi:hypothetical protein